MDERRQALELNLVFEIIQRSRPQHKPPPEPVLPETTSFGEKSMHPTSKVHAIASAICLVLNARHLFEARDCCKTTWRHAFKRSGAIWSLVFGLSWSAMGVRFSSRVEAGCAKYLTVSDLAQCAIVSKHIYKLLSSFHMWTLPA